MSLTINVRRNVASARTLAPPYRACFAAQVGALGASGQRRLQDATVLVAGAGGLGTAITSGLALSGVGVVFVVDPQRIDASNFNRYPFVRARDIGRPKVDALAGFFDGRPYLKIVPVFKSIEDLEPADGANAVDLVVAAANTISARMTVARFAAQHHCAHVSAALIDGREGKGGIVTAWCPERPDLACPACHIGSTSGPRRGESLLATVVSTVGGIAASVAVQLLAELPRTAVLNRANYISADLEAWQLDAATILRREECPCCQPAQKPAHRMPNYE